MTTTISPRPGTTRRRRGAFLTLSALVTGSVVALVSLSPADAATPTILLGTSDSFAILAGAGITNTGATSIAGDVGTFPTPSQTGFETVTLDGVNHVDDAVTQQAKDDLTTAYDQAAGSGPTTDVATELGGRTLTPGVYGNETLGITGTLTLDTLGDPHAVFVFQAATTLTTATDSAVVILGGGEACNVFWQIGSSATLGTRSHLVGSVLADTSITATTGATIEGRLLAGTGEVTLDHNTVTRSVCSDSSTTTSPSTSTTTTTTSGESGSTTVPTTEGTTPTTAAPGATVPESDETVPPAEIVTTGTTADMSPPSADRPTPGSPPADVPPATTPPTATPPGAGPPSTVPGPSAPRLPYTGSDPIGLAVAGLVLLGLGTAATVVSRRRVSIGSDRSGR